MRVLRICAVIGLLVFSAGCSSDDSAEDVTDTTAPPWSGHVATPDTEPVYGRAITVEDRQAGSGMLSSSSVEWVNVAFVERFDMSDLRASGDATYTATLYLPDPTGSVGGPWVPETVTLTNDEGSWNGYAMGNYTYTQNLPDVAIDGSVIVVGEWHLVGSGAYEGLRLDLYSGSGSGDIGTIRPAG
jgi:hypothetical protein